MLGGRTLAFKQLSDTSKSRLDVRRDPLEVDAEIVQKVRDRCSVKVPRAVRLVARLHSCLVERGLQLTASPLMSCLLTLVLPLERLQAFPQFTNHLAPSFCERKSFFSGSGKVRPSAEVQVEEETGQCSEGR